MEAATAIAGDNEEKEKGDSENSEKGIEGGNNNDHVTELDIKICFLFGIITIIISVMSLRKCLVPFFLIIRKGLGLFLLDSLMQSLGMTSKIVVKVIKMQVLRVEGKKINDPLNMLIQVL